MILSAKSRLLLAASAALFLAACDSAEERAEKHYESAIELIESGDVSRGMVELRNVLQLDETHKEARLLFAEQLMARNRVQEAYGQYLNVAERFPDETEPRIILAELALENRQWEEVERHGARAIELAPNDPRVEYLQISLDYRAAVLAEDAPARREATRRAMELFETSPDHQAIAAIVVESHSVDGELSTALEYANRALEEQPENEALHLARLSLLERTGEADALEGYLVELNQRFPDQAQYQQMMLRYFGLRGELTKAEAFLREITSPLDEDLADYIGLVQFLRDTQGIDAALEELDSALATRPDAATLSALRASLLFDSGERDQGISELEALLTNAEPSDNTRRFKVALARMLLATENKVGARKLVEEVLAEDSLQVEAVKLQANWMIEDDRNSEAISILRRALDAAPDDPELMTLMAQAHARNGDAELSRDLLSLAAEASGFAPEESVRYARALMDVEEYSTAETTLISSLRARPNTLITLSALAEVYLRTEDWPRAGQVEANLRRLENEESTAAADRIRVALLNRQDRSEDALSFLEEQFVGSEGDKRTLAALIRGYIASGDTERARATLDASLSEEPDDPQLRFMDGALLASVGDLEGAEAVYRQLLSEFPTNERLWVEIMRIVGAQGKTAEVAVLLDEGLTHLPESPNLLWAKASQLEREFDIDGAIEIYERLYAQSSSSVVAANNLASLLSTHRAEDPESVDRAYRIARRLRGTENPAFQDTYGWLAYLQGDYSEAIEYLEPAANALPNDPLVQFHLAMAYFSAQRLQDAEAQFQRALDLAGSNDPREQFDLAREKLAELQSPSDTQQQ